MVQVDIMSELARIASSTLLQLLVCLRHWYKHSNVSIDSGSLALSTNLTNIQPLLSSSNGASLKPKTNSLSLKYILKNIVDWIIISGEASQKLKINLYASLLNFMHIVKGFNSNEPTLEEHLKDK